MKRRSRARTLKNDLIWRGLQLASRGAAALGLGSARRIGAALGRTASVILPREAKRATANLRMALPGLDPAAVKRIRAGMFRHLGVSLMEIGWLPNLDRAVLDETTRFEGLENLSSALAQGRGVVLFTGHCGNWEWMAAAIGLMGFPMNVVARELYDPRINDFVVASRKRHGVETIGRGSGNAAREILATLRRGHILGVLIDQSIRAENAEVPFFGMPAPTPTGPARLAIRAGAAAITGFIERRGEQQVIRFEPYQLTERSDDPVALTAEMTAAIEAQIRRVPEQWVWMHKRWTVR